MDKFRGKRALVTGGGSGIGKDLAKELLKLGAEVIVVGRTAEKLNALRTETPNIHTIQLDIGDFQKTKEIMQTILPVHLLVNNAATALLTPALDATSEEFDDSFNINVKALMNITQIVSKDLISRKESGRIVNISSQAGQRAIKNHLIYCSTKAAVDMMTKVFALELGPHNIRVNAVSPTVVMTDMGKIGWSDPQKAGKMLARIPQGRFAEVSEVVNVILFLLSDESEMVNGHSLPVDGGFLAC